MATMEEVRGVPAGGNPDHRSDRAVPVMNSARAQFENAVPSNEILYDADMGPRSLEHEPTLEERIEANRQFEAARLAKVQSLGVAPPRPQFQYKDHRPEVFVDETSVPDIELDFPEPEVDENGDIVDESDEFTPDPAQFPDAVPAPRRGRPPKK